MKETDDYDGLFMVLVETLEFIALWLRGRRRRTSRHDQDGNQGNNFPKLSAGFPHDFLRLLILCGGFL